MHDQWYAGAWRIWISPPLPDRDIHRSQIPGAVFLLWPWSHPAHPHSCGRPVHRFLSANSTGYGNRASDSRKRRMLFGTVNPAVGSRDWHFLQPNHELVYYESIIFVFSRLSTPGPVYRSIQPVISWRRFLPMERFAGTAQVMVLPFKAAHSGFHPLLHNGSIHLHSFIIVSSDFVRKNTFSIQNFVHFLSIFLFIQNLSYVLHIYSTPTEFIVKYASIQKIPAILVKEQQEFLKI